MTLTESMKRPETLFKYMVVDNLDQHNDIEDRLRLLGWLKAYYSRHNKHEKLSSVESYMNKIKSNGHRQSVDDGSDSSVR